MGNLHQLLTNRTILSLTSLNRTNLNHTSLIYINQNHTSLNHTNLNLTNQNLITPIPTTLLHTTQTHTPQLVHIILSLISHNTTNLLLTNHHHMSPPHTNLYTKKIHTNHPMSQLPMTHTSLRLITRHRINRIHTTSKYIANMPPLYNHPSSVFHPPTPSDKG